MLYGFDPFFFFFSFLCDLCFPPSVWAFFFLQGPFGKGVSLSFAKEGREMVFFWGWVSDLGLFESRRYDEYTNPLSLFFYFHCF